MTRWHIFVFVLLASVSSSYAACKSVDGMILIDTSSGVSDDDLANLKLYSKELIRAWDFTTSTATIINFGGSMQTMISFDSRKNKVFEAIDNINKKGGSTKTYLGLNEAERLLKQKGRSAAEWKVIVITAASSGDTQTATAARNLEIIGATVYVILPFNRDSQSAEAIELKEVATNPDTDSYIEYNTYAEMVTIGAGPATKTVCRTLVKVCSAPIDGVLLLDTSNAVDGTGLAELKRFAKNIVSVWNFTASTLSIINFGKTFDTVISSSSSKTDIVTAIDGMTLKGERGFNHLALEEAKRLLDANKRDYSRAVVILVSAVRNKYAGSTETATTNLKSSGAFIYVIMPAALNDTTDQAYTDLVKIASEPAATFVSSVDDHTRLGMDDIYRMLINVCNSTLQSNTSGLPDNKGKEFMVAFGENFPNSGDIELFLTTSGAGVKATVTVPQDPTLLNTDVDVTAGTIKLISLPQAVRMLGQGTFYGIKKAGVLITSTDEIIVYASNKDDKSADAFMALPTDVLGTDYYVPAWPMTKWEDSSQIDVVAVEDDTVVVFTLPAHTSNFQFATAYKGSDAYKYTTYRAKSALSITLNRGEAYQLQTSQDLTSTRVQSNKPLGVLSGNLKTSVYDRSQDHLVEMIPPHSSWGKYFITVPLAQRKLGDIFRIIVATDNTTVTMTTSTNKATTQVTLDAGTFKELDVSSDEFYYISSTEPVLVVQYCKSYERTYKIGSDPFMSIVVPIEQFSKDYTFATPEAIVAPYTNFIAITCKTSICGQLVLDKKPIKDASFSRNWTKIDGPSEDMSVAVIYITHDTHTLIHPEPTAVYGLSVYGHVMFESFGYPGGTLVSPLYGACVVKDVKVNDGFDNDCDGSIDEELADGKDNDGDGLIDEDTAETTNNAYFASLTTKYVTTTTEPPTTTTESPTTTTESHSTTVAEQHTTVTTSNAAVTTSNTGIPITTTKAEPQATTSQSEPPTTIATLNAETTTAGTRSHTVTTKATNQITTIVSAIGNTTSDLVIVVDITNSLTSGDFNDVKQFMKAVISAIDFGSSGAQRVAIVGYGETTQLIQDFTTVKGDLQLAINNMTTQGGNTTTFKALDMAKTIISQKGRNGSRHNVLLISADLGPSQNATASANSLKANGVRISAVVPSSSDFSSIVSEPAADNICLAKNYASLNTTLAAIMVNQISSVQQAPAATTQVPSTPPIDALFMIDTSDAISESDFKDLRIFSKELVSKMDFSDGIRLAVLNFGANNEVQNVFSGNKSSVLDAIQAMKMKGGNTAPLNALNEAMELYNTSSRGDAKKVVVFVGKGSNQVQNTSSAVRALEAVGTSIFVVSPSTPTPQELVNMATTPASTHLIQVNDYASLNSDVVDNILSTAFQQQATVKTVLPNIPSDVVLLLDSSDSVAMADFQSVKEFGKDIVTTLNSASAQVSVLNFGSRVTESGTFSSNQNSNIGFLNSMSYKGGQSNTTEQLDRVRNLFLQKGRNDVKRVAILLAPGSTSIDNATKTAARNLESMGVTVYVVVPSTNLNDTANSDFKELSSDPDSKTFSQVDGYASLNQDVATSLVDTIFNINPKGVKNSAGKEFMLAFGENYNKHDQLELFVTTSSLSGDVNVTVTVPRDPTIPTIQITVKAGSYKRLILPRQLRMTGTGTSDGPQNNAVLVLATNEVMVYGANKGDTLTDAFMAIPTEALGMDYFVPSWSTLSCTDCSQIAVVGVRDNTIVEITLPSTPITMYTSVSNSNSSGNYTTFPPFRKISITLQKGQTYQLQSSQDLSGTRVTSNKPVAVMSGSKETGVEGNATSGHLEEMIPPSSTWGKQFVVTPSTVTNSSDILRVLGSSANTTIRISSSSGNTTTMNTIGAGIFKDLTISPGEIYYIESDEPVLLAEYSQSGSSSKAAAKPFMSIVTPLERYEEGYSFATPPSQTATDKSYISIVCKTSECSQLYLDGKPISAATYINNWSNTSFSFDNESISVATVEVDTGPHTLFPLNAGVKFGVKAYGPSYGYPVGAGLAPINDVTTTLTTTTVETTTSQEVTTTVFLDNVILAIASELSKQIGGGLDTNGDVPPEVVAGATVPTLVVVLGTIGGCCFFFAFKKRKREKEEEELSDDEETEEDEKQRSHHKSSRRKTYEFFRSPTTLVGALKTPNDEKQDDDSGFRSQFMSSSPETMSSDVTLPSSPSSSAGTSRELVDSNHNQPIDTKGSTPPCSPRPIDTQSSTPPSSPRLGIASRVSMNPNGDVADSKMSPVSM